MNQNKQKNRKKTLTAVDFNMRAYKIKQTVKWSEGFLDIF